METGGERLATILNALGRNCSTAKERGKLTLNVASEAPIRMWVSCVASCLLRHRPLMHRHCGMSGNFAVLNTLGESWWSQGSRTHRGKAGQPHLQSHRHGVTLWPAYVSSGNARCRRALRGIHSSDVSGRKL